MNQNGGQRGRNRPRSLRVVAALVRVDGRVLLTQRRPGRHLGLSWEFPGGKVEEGESDEEAVRRELREELGIEVKVGTLCFETRHTYGSREIHLLVYRSSLVSGDPRALDVNAFDWVPERELGSRAFLPADMPLVNGLVNGLIAYDDAAADPDDAALDAGEQG
jgi:8-oxo-dGTP diphosphatase